MRRLTRIFKWAVSEELVPAPVYQALVTEPGLKKGRCDLREPQPILPVDRTIVNQTLEHLPKIIADMVRLQLTTGMRPSEVCTMRPMDIDRTGEVWEYRPATHKTEHHSRTRVVYLGPSAQALIAPYCSRDAADPCFSPRENLTEFLAERAVCRKTSLTCGNRPGTNRKDAPRKGPGRSYTAHSYRQAIHRACDRAFPPPAHLARRGGETKAAWRSRLGTDCAKQLKMWQSSQRWSPNQLRHAAATAIRREYGLEAAQVILGHAAADVTQIYAERDADKAREIVRQTG